MDLEPSTSLYHLHAGEEAPIVTCKTDCYPACDVTWHKVGVNSSSVYNLENVLNLGTFETRKIGEYICVAKRRGTGDIGVRGVTFKMKDKTGMKIWICIQYLHHADITKEILNHTSNQ